MSPIILRNTLSLVAASTLCTVAFGQDVTPLGTLLQRSEQQKQFIQDQIKTLPESTPITVVKNQANSLAENSSSCFAINTINVDGIRSMQYELSDTFSAYGFSVKAEQGEYVYAGKKPPCLNADAIQNMASSLQNILIDKGLITTRVLIPEQNLADGSLKLAVITGRVGEIKYAPQSDGTQMTLEAAFPTSTGSVVNLRDLEQGLDNLRRPSNTAVSMDITPGNAEGLSDIVVNRTQTESPLFLSATIDDSGSKAVGRYLGTIGLGWENPLSLNDTLQVSYSHTLKPGVTLTDDTGKQHSGSNNYNVQYVVPIGYWHFNINASKYSYDQIVPGQTRNYRYTGESKQGSATLAYTLYRSQRLKTKLQYGLWQRSSRNYIDDTEVDVQRRRTGGWEAHLNQLIYFNQGSISFDLGYKRGTGAFGSMKAPESYWDEGTGRMKIWTSDIDWQRPFNLGSQSFSWRSRFHGQWPKTRLTSLDKISIGGRNTVRGYNGEVSLTAERGWYLRNDLSWYYKPQHRIYLGLDTGHVSGPSAKYLPGKTLTGSALGASGSFDAKGAWFYDAFIGLPIKYPEGFPAKNMVAGFTFSYRWP